MRIEAGYDIAFNWPQKVPMVRHNYPRIGRIVVAHGRDAADVAISTGFGPSYLARFTIVTEQLSDGDTLMSPASMPTPKSLEALASLQFA